MRNLANFSVEFEDNHTGNMFSTQDIKTLKICNHESYPVTFGVVKEYKKALSKQILKSLKNPSMHSMITVFGYTKGYYETVNICRFTYDNYAGKVHVDYRPYSSNGFEIQVTKQFDTHMQAKNYMLNLIESHIFENINIKPNSENYFTENM